jgi:hypothetical protein
MYAALTGMNPFYDETEDLEEGFEDTQVRTN